MTRVFGLWLRKGRANVGTLRSIRAQRVRGLFLSLTASTRTHDPLSPAVLPALLLWNIRHCFPQSIYFLLICERHLRILPMA